MCEIALSRIAAFYIYTIPDDDDHDAARMTGIPMAYISSVHDTYIV